MIIKKIKKEEIKDLNNIKEIIVKEDNNIQNYQIVDNYRYINKSKIEVFVNEKCLVDNKGYFYRVSKLNLYHNLEFFLKYDEGYSKTKIMKYFNFALVNNKKYIIMIISNNGIKSISIIINTDETTLNKHLKYWISEDNNNIILKMFLLDSLDLISSLIKI